MTRKTGRSFAAYLRRHVAPWVLLFAGLGGLMTACKKEPVARNADRVMPAVTAKDTMGLASLRADFSRTAAGRDLLKVADDNQVVIVFDPTLKDSVGCFGIYEPPRQRVSLWPGLNKTQQRIVLAHELRHVWQDRALHYSELLGKSSRPSDRWAIMRYTEADAFTYAGYYWADYIIRTNTADPTYYPGAEPSQRAAAAMLEDMRDCRLSPDIYREKALERCFASLGINYSAHPRKAQEAMQNIEKDLDSAKMMIKDNNKAKARHYLSRVMNTFAQNPSRADIITALREYGGMSLVPGAQSAMRTQTVTDDVAFNQYTFMTYGLKKSDIDAEKKKLADADKKYDALKAEAAALDRQLNPKKNFLQRLF